MHRSTLSKLATPLLFTVMLLHGACAPADADPGKLAQDVRAVGPFHGIEIAGTIEVEARRDAVARVEVIGEPDRLKQVITTVQGGMLRIDTKGKLDKSHLRVVVSSPTLDAFSITGTGDLRASGLTGGAIDASISGTGAMRLEGKAQSLRLTVDGTGEIRAKDLVVGDATVDIKGTGDAKLHATRSLDATITGTGAIRVHGRPSSIKKTINGVGVIDVH